MALLLSSFGKQGISSNLLAVPVDIEDTSATSKYFAITEFPKVFTAGKNSFAFNGTNLLKNGSEIKVECLDSAGNSLYLEQAKSQDSQFTDASKFVVSVHIYNETYNGSATVILVGTTTLGEVVRWIGNLTIDKTLDNTSKVRFINRPTLEVRPLLYPVVDTQKVTVTYPPPPVISTATATATIKSYVKSATLTAAGSGYTSASIAFDNTGTSGSGAAASANLFGGAFSSITITDGGNGYIKPPKIIITGDGTNATAVAVLQSVVSSVNMANHGAGYTFVPSVIFTSTNGNGAGASATAVMSFDGKSVDHVNIDLPDGGGNGYLTIPTVTFTVPDRPPAPTINVPVAFSASFGTYAVNPPIDSNKNTLNLKQTDVDYRLTIVSSLFKPLNPSDFAPQNFPSSSFNSQMENQPITLHISRVKLPHSTKDIPVHITASFTIKKVIDSKTIQLDQPFFYTIGKNQFVANITAGHCFVNYRFMLYNTAPDSVKYFPISSTQSVPVKESYAEVVYRNIKCFTGFVARHKLYRKSSLYPGDFQLLSDEKLGPPELLSDQITFNRFYDKMGTFYNQPHINKYWFSESPFFTLHASTSPINSMRIESAPYAVADGTKGILVKNDTVGGVNDALYRPYDATQFNNLSGSSYNSNFVNLKKGVLYLLSANVSLQKDPLPTQAGVSFYFTSSIANIQQEPTYTPRFGMKLGEITTSDAIPVKYFQGTQYFYFTPQDDYFGTLVVVPKNCSPTLSNVSLQVYGDHGFSPDIHDIRIPFPVNIANEAFIIKAELLDLNSNVVYSNLLITQTFDPNGDSLYALIAAAGGTVNVTINQGTTTIAGSPYFPDLTNCDATTRLVGWHIPQGAPDDGKLCYTNVSQLYIDSDDYIFLHEFQSGVEHVAKSIAVQYDFLNNFGRKIFIDASGNKTTFP